MAQMQLVAYHRGVGNTEAANVILNNLDANYQLTDWQQNLLAEVQSFYTVFDNVAISGDSDLVNLDPTTQATLSTLSQNTDRRDGVYAQAWLKFSNEELYLPEVIEYSPPAGKKEQESIFKLREVEKETIFGVYPNPAKDFITIEIGTYQASSSIRVEIINSIGNTVLKNNVSQQGNYNLNLAELPTGVYILKIMDGDAEIQKQVIEILK